MTNAGISGAGGTAFSNVVWFATSARGIGPVRLQSVIFSDDIAAQKLTLYSSTNYSTITNNGVNGTNQLWLDNTGFASNDVIVIRFVNQDSYQRCVVTNAAAGQLSIWPSAGLATTTNDMVYKMTSIAQLNSLAAGTTNYAGTLFYGRAGYPMLADMQYSNTAAINLIAGEWLGR